MHNRHGAAGTVDLASASRELSERRTTVNKTSFQIVPWHDRSARLRADETSSTTRAMHGGWTPGWGRPPANDVVDDEINDEDLPALPTEQYESVWEVMLAHL
jgi:hypothetical protein